MRGGEFRCCREVAAEGVAGIKRTAETVIEVGREGKGIAQVTLVGIEAAVVVVGVEIGHVDTKHQATPTVVGRLPQHPAPAIGGRRGLMRGVAEGCIELRAGGQSSKVVAYSQAQPVLRAGDEWRDAVGFGGTVVTLLQTQTVARQQCQLPMAPAQLQQVVGGVRRLRHLIAGPRKIGVVGIGEQLQMGRSLPRGPQQHTAFVLHVATLAETRSMQRVVVVAIKTLHSHQPQRGHRAEAQRVDGCQRTLFVDGGLTTQRQSPPVVAVVYAHVSKRLAFGIDGTITACPLPHFTGTLQRQIVAIGQRRQSGLPVAVLPTQPATHEPLRGIVLALHFRRRAVVARREPRADGRVARQRGIYLPIRDKSRQVEVATQRYRGGSTLQIVGRHARRMGRDGGRDAPHAVEHREFS